MPGPFDMLTPRPSILDSVLGKIFPAPADAESVLAPEDIAGARRRSLANVGASLLKSGGPHPAGTTNIGQNIGQALQDANFPGTLDEAAQRAAAYSQIASKAGSQKAIQAIMAKYPAQPGETAEQAMQRFEQMVPDLIGAGLYDQASKLQELIAKSKPGADRYVAAAPGTTILKAGPNGDLVPAYTAPANVKPTPDQAFEQGTKLRTEFTGQTAPYANVARAYRTLKDAVGLPVNSTSDQALVYSYMKMLDPTMTLLNGQRAGEQNASGVGKEYVAIYNFILDNPGKSLGREQRAAIIGSAQALLKTRAREFRNIYQRYGKLAADYQLDPSHVVSDYFSDISEAPHVTGAGAEGDAVLGNQ